MKKYILKTAKRTIKATNGKIDFITIEKYLDIIGYKIIFFNTLYGDGEIKRYQLETQAKNLKAFTYSNAAQIVFIDNDIHSDDKLYLLLHELGHILLNHIGDGKLHLRNKILSDVEANAFVFEVLNYKRNNKVLYSILSFVLISILSFSIGYNFNHIEPTPYTVTTVTSSAIKADEAVAKTETPISTAETPVAVTELEFVYVTKTGSKYHRPSCWYVKNKNCISLSVESANLNYEPCKVCNPK